MGDSNNAAGCLAIKINDVTDEILQYVAKLGNYAVKWALILLFQRKVKNLNKFKLVSTIIYLF